MASFTSNGLDWSRVLAADEMVNSLKRSGWTGADLKEYTEQSKRENFGELDRFAGGGLSEAKGLPVYSMLLELTALRHAMHTTNAGEAGTLKAVPSECPHGFRMVACNTCLKGVA